jgi:4-hydroxy-tetrahydrodipicolinate synthase
MFEGVSVALVTPFRNGALDEAGLRRLVRYVLDQGVDGIVVTGSTGETATLTRAERERVWAIAREEVKGGAFLIAGTGSNATAETIELTRAACLHGVDGCMVVAPYYNKPQPRGQVAHFTAVADASSVPIMLYNVPSRTALNVLPDAVVEIAQHPKVVAVKEASGSIEQATEILRRSSVTVLSGDDALALPLAAVGGKGVVSVAGHVVGAELVAMLKLHRSGKVEEAAALHRRLAGFIRALFVETNPAPVKAALARRGVIGGDLRAPLASVTPETMALLEREMAALGLEAAAARQG